jgi:hypothetical protein
MATGSVMGAAPIVRPTLARYVPPDRPAHRDVAPGVSNAGNELNTLPTTQAGNLCGSLSGIDFMSTWTSLSTTTKLQPLTYGVIGHATSPIDKHMMHGSAGCMLPNCKAQVVAFARPSPLCLSIAPNHYRLILAPGNDQLSQNNRRLMRLLPGRHSIKHAQLTQVRRDESERVEYLSSRLLSRKLKVVRLLSNDVA